MIRPLVAGSLVLVLAGCQGLAVKPQATDPQPTGVSPAGELPFPQPATAPKELSPDIVFAYLVGEIGAHRGQLALSYNHYLQAAVLARDPYAAERATRIATHLKDQTAALRAARRWVELAPNALAARQSLAVLLLRADRADEAYEQARALIRIAQATDADGYLIVGQILAKEEDRAASLALVRRLAEADSDSARPWFAQSVIEVAGKRYADAEASLRKAAALEPSWPAARIALARVLLAQERQDAAISETLEALGSIPDDIALRTLLARMYVDAERYDDAKREFKQLLEQQPDDPDTLYAVGMLGLQTDEYDAARAAFQRLRNQRERYGEATYFLAQTEEAAGNRDLAMGLYAAVTGGRLRTDAAIRRAQLHAEMGQLPESREILQRTRVLDPRRAIDIYLVETQLLQEYGEIDDVMALYETALGAHPGNSDLLYNRALYAAERDQIELLERDLRTVLDKEPDHADALNALGYTLADRTDRFDEAFALISKANKLKPNNPAILDSLGWVYYRLGNYEEALKYLRQALELVQDSEIAAHLGEVLWVTGDREEARQVWEGALREDPDSVYLRRVMDRFQLQ